MIKNRRKKGFTLIELIVVIAILGILAAVLIPKFSGFQDKAHGTQALVEAKQWATAADAYLIEKGVSTLDAAAITAISGTAGTSGAVSSVTVDATSGHVFFSYTVHGQTATRTASGYNVTGEYTVTP